MSCVDFMNKDDVKISVWLCSLFNVGYVDCIDTIVRIIY